MIFTLFNNRDKPIITRYSQSSVTLLDTLILARWCAVAALYLLFSVSIISCGPTRSPQQSAGHIGHVAPPVSNIPETLPQTTLLPPPQERPQLETYTVVVSGVSVKDLLFSIARDAKINLDIHDDIEGNVTLNAIDQTLPQILHRISEQANIRYSIEDDSLSIRADKPYLHTYKVDYVNISRTSKGVVRVSTNIGSTGQGNIGDSQSSSSKSENNSSLTEVNLKSDNMFWETLSHNLIEIITGANDDISKS